MLATPSGLHAAFRWLGGILQHHYLHGACFGGYMTSGQCALCTLRTLQGGLVHCNGCIESLSAPSVN